MKPWFPLSRLFSIYRNRGYNCTYGLPFSKNDFIRICRAMKELFVRRLWHVLSCRHRTEKKRPARRLPSCGSCEKVCDGRWKEDENSLERNWLSGQAETASMVMGNGKRWLAAYHRQYRNGRYGINMKGKRYISTAQESGKTAWGLKSASVQYGWLMDTPLKNVVIGSFCSVPIERQEAMEISYVLHQDQTKIELRLVVNWLS